MTIWWSRTSRSTEPPPGVSVSDARGFSDAGFATDARCRRRSVSFGVVSSHSVNESERLPRLRRGRSHGSAHLGNPRVSEGQPHRLDQPPNRWPTVRRRQP
jgi:hypothetical protein